MQINGGDLPQKMANRDFIQTVEAKLPSQMFFWRKCKCHRESNLDYSNCKPFTVCYQA